MGAERRRHASSDSPLLRRGGARAVLVRLLVACFLDVACALLLYLSIGREGRKPAWRDLGDVRGDTLGLLVLAAARVLFVLAMAGAAARLGTAPRPPRTRPVVPELGEPLLAPHGSEEDPAPAAAAAAAGEFALPTPSSLAAMNMRERKRDTVVFLLFVTASLTCLFEAVTCSTFHFAAPPPHFLRRLPHLVHIRIVLMASGIVFGNLEALLASRWVEISTARTGHLKPSIHPHPLTYASVPNHRCDVCRTRVREAMRCAKCDFDVCVRCFAKGDRATGEGGVRSDRGVRVAAAHDDKGPLHYLWRAARTARSEWRLMLAALVCLVITNVAALATPNYTGSILDRVVQNDRGGFKRDVAILAAVSLTQAVLGGFRALCFRIVGRKVAMILRRNLFSQLLSQDVAFFDAAATGDLVSRLTSDVTVMCNPIISTLSSACTYAIQLVGGLVCALFVSWRLTLLAFTTLVPAAYITKRFAQWSSSLNAQIFTSLGDANKTATDALGNVRTVKSCACEDLERAKYQGFLDRALREGITDAKGGAVANFLTTALDLGSSVIVLWFGGTLALEHIHGGGSASANGLTVGRLITFQLYWNMFNNAFTGIQSLLVSFTRSAGAATRVWTMVDNFPDIGESGGEGSALWEHEAMGPAVTLADVVFAYQMRPDVPVLRGLSLGIAPNEVGALVGPSGGGKSTIVHLLLRFYDPRGGVVKMDGVDLRELSVQGVRRRTGVVSQDTQLFAESILYNICYGVHACEDIDAAVLGSVASEGDDGRAVAVDVSERDVPSLEDVLEACDKAQARSFIESFPDGLATRVGERGVRLSGGQRQRLAVARAFLRKPRLMLLDEATSALDSATEAELLGALRAIEVGRTTVTVAHRLSTVRHAHCIYVLEGGTVRERGTHGELLEDDGGLYASLWKAQSSNVTSP